MRGFVLLLMIMVVALLAISVIENPAPPTETIISGHVAESLEVAIIAIPECLQLNIWRSNDDTILLCATAKLRSLGDVNTANRDEWLDNIGFSLTT